MLYYPLGIFLHVCIISDIIQYTIRYAYDNPLLIYDVTLINSMMDERRPSSI